MSEKFLHKVEQRAKIVIEATCEACEVTKYIPTDPITNSFTIIDALAQTYSVETIDGVDLFLCWSCKRSTAPPDLKNIAARVKRAAK